MNTIKKRILKVSEIHCGNCENTIQEEISKLYGIIIVHPYRNDNSVEIEYDLLKINLKEIELKLAEIGYPVKKGFLNNLKTGFIKYSEKNEKDNLTVKPSTCCSNPDEILEKK